MDASLIHVLLVRRPLWKRVLRFPFVWHQHYGVLRRSTDSRLLALYGAWLMAGLTVTVTSRAACNTAERV